MNGRELFGAIYGGEKAERLPVLGAGPWGETLERWRTEGLGPAEDPNEALNLAGDDAMTLPLDLGMAPAFEVRVLEVGAQYVTLVDEYGVTRSMLRSDFERSGGRMSGSGAMSSMSHWIDFPVKDMRTWKALREERFQVNLEGRLPPAWGEQRGEFVRRSRTRWVWFFNFPLFGLFGGVRQLMGLEGMVYAIADEPELIHTMVEDLTDLWVGVFERLLGEVRLDMVTFFEDMCSTRAPIMGPGMFREFLAPGYRKVVGVLREMGVQQFFIDSDGNARGLIEEMTACGITGISPCEVNAGMDAQELRRDFPRLNLSGGIDKRALAKGPAAIDEELDRRFDTAWTRGRYTPSPDHGIPPDVSWENMRYYAQRHREHCERAPLKT